MKHKTLADSARILRWFAIAALVLLVAAFCAARLNLDLGPNVMVRSRTHAGSYSGLAAIADLGVLFFAVALIQLVRLLGRLGEGDLFAPRVTGAFRSFAFWLVVSAAVAIIAPPIAGLIGQSPGSAHRVEVRIDLRDIMFLLAGLVMFLVARMLDEAAKLDRELKEYV